MVKAHHGSATACHPCFLGLGLLAPAYVPHSGGAALPPSAQWDVAASATVALILMLLTMWHVQELRAHLGVLGITVLQGRSAIGEAHSARLHACRGSM